MKRKQPKTRPVNIRLEQRQFDAAKTTGEQTGRTTSSVLRMAIDKGLEKVRRSK
jgi:predicted DNA-binding protein